MSAAQGKWCAKCRSWIPPQDVQLAPGEDERCHDCADYCDEPGCARCAARTNNLNTNTNTKE